MSEKPSLAVCTCSGRHPVWPYTFSVARMLTQLGESFARATYQVELGYATDMARNRLVKFAREGKYSHILFIDDDMSFPPNAAARLLAHGKAIVGANYTCRVFPVVPLAGKDGWRVYSGGKTGIEQVDFVPTGMMLVETRVFDDIELPWFQSTFQPGDPWEFMSDDVYFCNKARKQGHEVWVDHALSNEIGHCGQIEFHMGMVEPPPPPPPQPLLEVVKGLVAPQ